MMTAGQRLYPDTEATLGPCVLRLQSDGNLVLYCRGVAVWESGTVGRPPLYAEFQADANLVIYWADGSAPWSTGSVGAAGVLRVDGTNFEIVTQSVIWRQPLTLPEMPPAPAPIALSRLRVEDNRRWFANDAGRFDYREISAFSLLSRVLAGEDDYVRAWLTMARGSGCTVARVIITLDGDYWTRSPLGGRSFRCAPDMPGYWAALDRLGDIAGQVGIYLRLVFLGAVEPFGGVWHPDRRDVWHGNVREKGEAFAVEVAQRCASWPHAIYELCNEPAQIGMRESFDELIRLGAKVKAVAPDTLLGGGSVDGANDQDVRFAVAPFDYVDAHIDRRMGVRGFEWVKRSGEYAPIDQEHVGKRMPFISGEPVNFGEWRVDGRNGDVERSPSVAFAYGAVSRARQYNTNVHFDGGLWTTVPQPATVECIRAYHQALDAFPMRTGTRWRGHWQPQSYFRQVWPDSDDVRSVESHVASGRGPWRVFGADEVAVAFPEPEGWDWRAHVIGDVERVAYMPDGAFAVGIYRRK